MPKEMFPQKKPGDGLAASHVNDLGRVVSNLSGGNQGSGLQGTFGWITGIAGDVGPFLRIAKIKQETSTDGVFEFWLRYWDEENGKWKWNEDDDYYLDARCFTVDPHTGDQRAPVLVHDDMISVRYDGQRGMWLPNQFLFPESRWAWIASEIPARSDSSVSSGPGKLVEETLDAAGTAISWAYKTDYSGAAISINIFNGFPDAIPAELHVRVGWNSIGQYEIKGVPCSEDEELPL